MKMRNLLAVSLLCGISLTLSAQQSLPPPPKPAADGPTLAATMQFIQDKLNDNGKASWIDTGQITLYGDSNWSDIITHQISNVVADQGQCRISYHLFSKHVITYRFIATSDGKNSKGENSSFSLRTVQEIVVKPWEQYETGWLAKNGHPDTTVTASAPPMTALVVRQPHGVENVFTLTDAALTDRLAKAMIHAVELCGGGQNGPEPF